MLRPSTAQHSGLQIMRAWPPQPTGQASGRCLTLPAVWPAAVVTYAASLETSVLIRALKAISEVMWNSWAHYHPIGEPAPCTGIAL